MITIWKVRALLNQRSITADEDKDFLLQDNSDGAGPFIANWDATKLGAEPTEADLDALQTEADALRNIRIDEKKLMTGLLDLGFIVTKLIDILLTKALIAPTDFDSETKQEYLDLKALVDKLRP